MDYFYLSDLTIRENGLDNGSSWNKVNTNLNSGNEGTPLYLYYKLSKSLSDAITGIQIVNRSSDEKERVKMEGALNKLSKIWTRIEMNVNKYNSGGDHIYVYFQKHGTGTPISSIKVSENKGEMDEFLRKGYIRIPVNLNKGGKGNQVYLWYRHTYSPPPLTNLALQDYQDSLSLLENNFYRIDANLNEHGGWDLYLWYKRDGFLPITQLVLHKKNESSSKNSDNESMYRLSNLNLNYGAGTQPLYLYSSLSKHYYPIVNVTVVEKQAMELWKKNSFTVLDICVNQGNESYLGFEQIDQGIHKVLTNVTKNNSDNIQDQYFQS